MAFKTSNTVVILFIVGFFLLFTSPNLNFETSTFYSVMLFMIAIGIIFDINRKENLPLLKGKNIFENVVWSVGALAVFFVISIVITGAISGTSQSVSSVTNLWAQAQVPLSESQTLNSILYAIVIPFLESILFFGIGYEFFAEFLGIPLTLNLKNRRQFALIGILALAFTATHFAVRGVTNVPGLTITFIFAIISQVMILRRGHTIEAWVFHGMVNGIALGVIPFIA